MIYYSKIVKIKMDYITKYQYVKLIHFLRRHQLIGTLKSSFIIFIDNDNPMHAIIWKILQESGDFTWRVSDCEELVGGKITTPLCSTSKNNVEQLKLS